MTQETLNNEVPTFDFRRPQVIYFPIIRIAGHEILSSPSQSSHNVLLFGHEVPNTSFLSQIIIRTKNRIQK
jgi:hypothetical protein